MDKKYHAIILSGGFDPVHVGHVRMFNAAKKLANIVIVGLNSNDWLTRKKGKPFMDFEERREILENLKSVDRVWWFDDSDDTANDLIAKVVGLLSMTEGDKKTVAFGNGGDRTAKNVPEQELCDKLGVTLEWGVGGDDKPQSSSWLLDNAKKD